MSNFWNKLYPIGSMYGIYANIGGIFMVNVAIYSIHGSYGYGFYEHNADLRLPPSFLKEIVKWFVWTWGHPYSQGCSQENSLNKGVTWPNPPKVVAMIHGLEWNSDSWMKNSSTMADLGFRVLSLEDLLKTKLTSTNSTIYHPPMPHLRMDLEEFENSMALRMCSGEPWHGYGSKNCLVSLETTDDLSILVVIIAFVGLSKFASIFSR